MDYTKKQIGFIGGGEMAYGVAMGILSGGVVDPGNMHISNRSIGKLDRFSKEGMKVTQDNMKIFSTCDVVFLAVKPQVFPVIAEEIKLKYCKGNVPEKIIVSIMAAITIETMQKVFGEHSKIIRTCPNIACSVRAGSIVVSKCDQVSDDEYKVVKKLLSNCAECFECEEKLANAANSISGCASAYFFMAIEALADGGVKHGLPRSLAIKLAATSMMGSAKQAKESGVHPAELKDRVASPGGTTIQGIHALEKRGFRCALMDAVDASTTHAMTLAKK